MFNAASSDQNMASWSSNRVGKGVRRGDLDHQKSFLIIIESDLIDLGWKGFYIFTKLFIGIEKYKI